jgi:hypothetical protein
MPLATSLTQNSDRLGTEPEVTEKITQTMAQSAARDALGRRIRARSRQLDVTARSRSIVRVLGRLLGPSNVKGYGTEPKTAMFQYQHVRNSLTFWY